MDWQSDFDAVASAASVAAFAVCTNSVVTVGCKAPASKYMVKGKQQKQRRQQHQNLLGQFIQFNIPLPSDVMGLNIPLTA